MYQKLRSIVRAMARPLGGAIISVLSLLLRIFPIKANKVLACVSVGQRYDDNQKFIMEELHRLYPEADIVWVKNRMYPYEVPEWMRSVNWASLRWVYEHATAKIWINNELEPRWFSKRKGQFYIETWHGGLGIKKIYGDAIGECAGSKDRYLGNNTDLADVFISNSDHLSKIYRRAFNYHGPIWKCGYPKNDMLVRNNLADGEAARKELGIPKGNKVLLYAPTWRIRFTRDQIIDMKTYDVDLQRLKHALTEKFGGEWSMLVRFHPNLRLCTKDYQASHPDIVDATYYQDMQGLLMATDVMISDYSSCIFDAALRRIPCFTYATDFEQYKNEERGVYYEMEELPFPYATNNDELEQNIKAFNEKDYLQKWDVFTVRMGLNETGHAAKDIAEKMIALLQGKPVEWKNDYPTEII